MLELDLEVVRDGFNLEVQLALAPGPTALVGPNGAGKSTLLRAILGAVPVRRGRIVLFSSIIADGEKGPLTTVTGRLPYATAKAALLGFTSQLAKDLAEVGITVNALMPGLILGEQGTRIRGRFDALAPEQRAALLSGYPGGRPGTGDEVAAAVAFLLSESAGFISGVALPVDGAYR